MAKKWLHQMALAALLIFVLAGIAGIAAWKGQGLKLYTMGGNSLAPALRSGDLLIVSPNRPPKLGDFANFADPANPRGVITQKVVDMDLDQNNLVGITVSAVPLMGYGLREIRQPIGLALIIYTPAFMVLRSESKRLRRHISRQGYILGGFAPVAH